MSGLARFLLLLYGVTLIVGGTLGYQKSASTDSLIWGAAGGVLAILAFGISIKRPKTGLFLGLLVAAGIAVRMFLRYFETQTMMPSGAVAILSVFMALMMVLGVAKAKK